MKVKIKDLHPNPFRDMENYPINPEKIESLKNSINQTGFWDNILARPKPKYTKIILENKENKLMVVGPKFKEPEDGWGGLNLVDEGKMIAATTGAQTNSVVYERPIIEIAYGHHRLMVLQELYKANDEVDIPVKELDDATMIRIMANENDENWGISPKVIDETVRVTKEFLLSDRGQTHIRTKNPIRKKDYFYSQLAFQIAEFLGENWEESRIRYSLDRLELSETEETHEKHIDKEAVEMYPTERSARNFTRAVKKIKNIKPEQQRKVAKRMVEKESFGEEAIKAELLDEKFATKKDKTEKKTIEFEDYIRECARLIEKVNEKLSEIIKLKESFDSDIYSKGLARFGFDAQIEILEQNLLNLLQKGGDKNVRKLQN